MDPVSGLETKPGSWPSQRRRAIAIHFTSRAPDAPAPRGVHSWQTLGACVGVGCDLFFSQVNHAAALEYCARCPVADPCLFEALVQEREAPRRFGVRGGTTAATRTEIARWLKTRGLDPAELLADETAWWARHLEHQSTGIQIAS